MAANAGAIKAGEAYVSMKAKDETAGTMRRVEAKLRAWGRNIASIGKTAFIGLAGAATAIGTAVVAISRHFTPSIGKTALIGLAGAATAIGTAVVAISRHFTQTGSELVDMSARTGMSVEALGELGHAFKMNGAELSDLETGTRKMQQTLADAAGGSAEAAKALAKMGLSVGDLEGLEPDKQMEKLLVAIGQLPSAAERTAAAMDIFGKAGTKLLPVAMSGAAGIAAMRKEAVDLGRMTTAQADQADALGDAWDRFTSAMGSMVNLAGSAVAPALDSMLTGITDGIVAVGQYIQQMGGLGGAAHAAWMEIQIAFLTGIDFIDGLTGGWLSYFQTFFNNIPEFAELAWTRIKLGAVVLGNVISHFFTGVLPAAAKWFAENWQDIFLDIFNWTKTVFSNLAMNIVKIIKNVPGLIAGDVTFAELWTPLTEGFQRASKELKLPERVQSDLEKQLRQEQDKLTAGLQAKVEAAPGGRQAEIARLRGEIQKIQEDAAKAKGRDEALQKVRPEIKEAGQAVSKQASRSEAVGTFSAIAARTLGGGVQESIKRNTERTAANTERLLAEVRAGIMVWG